MWLDRSKIMSSAWRLVRGFMYHEYQFVQEWTPGPGYGRQRGTTAEEKRAIFSKALRQAWASAKLAERKRAEQAARHVRPSEELAAEIQYLENRTLLGQDGIARLAALRTERNVPLAREAKEERAADVSRKRALIAAAKGRICAVTFVKWNGSRRQMKIQPASLTFHIKGESASDSGQHVAATRVARHPHLLQVWDAEAKAPRSVNLATVSRITVNGQVHHFNV